MCCKFRSLFYSPFKVFKTFLLFVTVDEIRTQVQKRGTRDEHCCVLRRCDKLASRPKRRVAKDEQKMRPPTGSNRVPTGEKGTKDEQKLRPPTGGEPAPDRRVEHQRRAKAASSDGG